MRNTSPSKSGKKDTTPNYRAPALEKGLDILELLAKEPVGLSQGEIARALGRSVSEIFRMLNCLVNRGYVVLHPDTDNYTISLRMFELSHRHPPMRRLISEALPLLTEVAAQTNQSCHLAVNHDDQILVVAQVDNPGSLGFAARMGAQLDLLETASGVVILTFQREDRQQAMLRTYEAVTGKTPNLVSLQEKFDTIRQQGHEESSSLQVESIRNISFPVMDFSGQAVCAITVPFLLRMDQENEAGLAMTRTALQQASAKLSTAIGALAHDFIPMATYTRR